MQSLLYINVVPIGFNLYLFSVDIFNKVNKTYIVSLNVTGVGSLVKPFLKKALKQSKYYIWLKIINSFNFNIVLLLKSFGYLFKNKQKVSKSKHFFPIITDGRFPVIIRKGKESKITINGRLIFQQWSMRKIASSIILAEKAELVIDGDFHIGEGVAISIKQNAKLNIGGSIEGQISGITANADIMVLREIEIGKGSIISWDTFITDSDWHKIEGKSAIKPTKIGNKVWIGKGATVLKGSRIGDGSIVGAHSVVSGIYPMNSLIAGVPSKIIRENVNWNREIDNIDDH